jgi:transmembrane sensor
MKKGNSIPVELEKWISEQNPADQEVYRKLWLESGGQPDDSGNVSEEELKEAYAAVSRTLFGEDDRDKESGTGSGTGGTGGIDETGSGNTGTGQDQKTYPDHETRIFRLTLFRAAAAVLIIAATIGYLVYSTGRINVHAAFGEQISYTFSDGSSVDLNSGSTITFRRGFSWTQRHVSLVGEAFFEIEGDDRPFIVETHNAIVKAEGTSFNVRSRRDQLEDETSVVLSDGSVQFFPRARPDNSVYLRAGQLSRLKELSEWPTEPEETNAERLITWRQGGLFFNDEPLERIFAEIERRFDARITANPQAIKNQRFSVLYSRPESAERVLRDICEENMLTMNVIGENRFEIY